MTPAIPCAAMEISFELAGPPLPKERAKRGITRGGRRNFYTPRNTRGGEDLALRGFYDAVPRDWRPHDGPVTLAVVGQYVPPASWPHWRRARAIAEAWPKTTRPDLDNLVKLVMDGLNGHAWHDDAQVWSHDGSRKIYGAATLTRVTLTLHAPPTTTKEI